jgi:Flp pilus assembly protein TadD
MAPGFPPADGLLGLYALDAGDTARCLAYFQERERRRPSSDLFYYYGICLGALGRTDEAVAKLLEAARLDPDDSEPYRVGIALLRKAGRDEEAERMLRMARERFGGRFGGGS